MLNTLHISDIILVEEATVCFKPGFNVITGETGAGKSAILRALALVLGQRADMQSLRQGAEKACVEAAFDTDYPVALRQVLEASGITYSPDEPLVLRREIAASGKNRAFINNQLAQVSTLKAVGSLLVDMVGQHANQELRDGDTHRMLVDQYGGLQLHVNSYEESWNHARALRRHLEDLVTSEARRTRQIEIFLHQLEELNEGNLKEGEEEELFAEYSRLAHADEIRIYADGVYQLLSGDEGAVLSLLGRQQNALQKAAGLDAELADSETSFRNALVELQEVAHTLRDYLHRLDCDPQRVQWLEERLALINSLKKKYGPLVSDVLQFRERIEQELKQLENADNEIETLRHELQAAEEVLKQQATALTQARKAAADKLTDGLTRELRSLNMPKVKVEVAVHVVPRHSQGEDEIEILFAPNAGERLIPISQCASGGELSRVILALKALLSDKQAIPTIIFDEVDANIGGETATVVGQKLAAIGADRQLLCITHFPQVASYAAHHIAIRKQETQGRTRTHVDALVGPQRTAELQRMAGGVRVTELVS